MIKLTGFADEISQELETQLDVLESEGISHLELRSVWNKNVLKLDDAEVKKVKERLDARGFKVSSIGSPIGKIKITDDFEPHLQDFRRALDLAKYFQTPYMRIFSFFIPEGDNPDSYEDAVLCRMRELVRLAEETDITLLHENEKDIYGDTGVRCQKLLISCSSSHLRSAFDPANYIQCNVRPMTEAYPLVEPFIDFIHVKDALLETRKVVPAGEGDGQLAELLVALKGKSYSGLLSLEPHLAASGKYEGFSGSELFVVATRALKKLLQEAEMNWQ